MDACGIHLSMKDGGSFCVCEAGAKVGFSTLDKACPVNVASYHSRLYHLLLPSGQLTLFTASENNEPGLGPPASTAVDNMSASPSSVDSHPGSTERELLTKLRGLFNTHQLLPTKPDFWWTDPP
ncbi:Beta-citrylglutamate synthase B, partial [Plecturocebus cupreus]